MDPSLRPACSLLKEFRGCKLLLPAARPPPESHSDDWAEFFKKSLQKEEEKNLTKEWSIK
jgi:hypothetical protein